MRKGQFFIITAVLIAAALLTITTMLSASQTVDYSTVLERYDTDIVRNVANEIQSEWWNASWGYRKNVVLRERNGSYLENESVALVLEARRSRVNDTCADIRPVAEDASPWVNTTACNIDTYQSDTEAVLRYLFDSGTGSVTEDATGNGFSGVFAGDPTWVSGRFAGGLDFESDDTVVVPDHFVLDLEGIAFTAAFWVFLEEGVEDGPKQLFVKGNGAPDGGRNYGMWVNEDETVQFRVDPGNQGISSTETALETGRWHHIAGVYEPGEDRLTAYIDGVEAGTADSVDMGSGSGNDGNFHLGESPANASANMVMDDFRLYNQSFSASTVRGIAQNGIGLNISVNLAPLEQKTVQLYYDNPVAAHPNHSASAFNTTPLHRRPVRSVGSTRGIREVMRKMQERVAAMDDSIGATLDLVIRQGCNLLTLQSPRTSLQYEVC